MITLKSIKKLFRNKGGRKFVVKGKEHKLVIIDRPKDILPGYDQFQVHYYKNNNNIVECSKDDSCPFCNYERDHSSENMARK